MGDLYSSAIGTTVLRLREMPQRPASYDGKVFVYTRHALRWERIGESPPSFAEPSNGIGTSLW